MSRSRKKIPITGMTTAPSDRPSKKRAHKQVRTAVRGALANGKDMPAKKHFGTFSDSDKDGKQYHHDWPAAIRK